MTAPARCDWAACHEPATDRAGGWWHCAVHISEHHALLRHDPDPVTEPRPRRRWSNPSKELVRLHGLGYTDKRIAAEMDYARSSVRRLRLDLGLKVNPARPGDGVALCGTRSGRQRHLRTGEQPCDACTSAEVTYQRDRYRRRTAA